jgi:hypothetical protein
MVFFLVINMQIFHNSLRWIIRFLHTSFSSKLDVFCDLV